MLCGLGLAGFCSGEDAVVTKRDDLGAVLLLLRFFVGAGMGIGDSVWTGVVRASGTDGAGGRVGGRMPVSGGFVLVAIMG